MISQADLILKYVGSFRHNGGPTVDAYVRSRVVESDDLIVDVAGPRFGAGRLLAVVIGVSSGWVTCVCCSMYRDGNDRQL
ncbi:hypothetical protein HanIR_Chr15g0736071 [Helianthus annuus]|nr:hypothetical protein HanIR_Chr15g0736071 [Helianthus annuus]